jgi:hypothetical protein
MNRWLSILAGPEVVLALLTTAVFLLCARHNSAGTDDVRVLERLIWLLPLVAVPVAFATLYPTSARTWIGLGRVNLALLVCLMVCAFRIVSGFGSGAKGQDAGFILVVSLGMIFSSLPNAISAALILREHKPAVDEWFRLRPVVGALLTGLAIVPALVVQTVATGLIAGVLGLAVACFKR